MRSFENGTLTMDGDPILGMPPLNKMRYSKQYSKQYSTVLGFLCERKNIYCVL